MYQTIENNAEFELVEKKSRFISNLIYVNSKLDAENNIKEIRKKYYDAKHNCYAYRVLENNDIYEKSSDDGEPSGTAGKPLLTILQKNNFCNVLAIVTRYFGGILLGTGGLVRAYSGATTGALDNCNKMSLENGVELEVEIGYMNLQGLKYYCQKHGIVITNIKYSENIICNIEMTNLQRDEFLLDIKNKAVLINEVKTIQEKYIKK